MKHPGGAVKAAYDMKVVRRKMMLKKLAEKDCHH